MKLIIAGSRSIDWWDTDDIHTLCERLPEYPTEVICGLAKGIDTLGWNFAKERHIPIKEFPAKWDEFGKRAGIFRNIEMSLYADALLAIWDGESRGTKHMIEQMLHLNKPIHVEWA